MLTIRLSLLAACISMNFALIAMEGEQEQPKQSQQRKIKVQELLSLACSETAILNNEQLVKYAATIEHTEEFILLLSTQVPAQLKMHLDELNTITGNTHKILNDQYKETWAPRTGIAAAACCLLTCLKPYLCGILDDVPTHEATIGLASFWTAEVKERTTQRNAVNNGSTVLKLIEAKRNQVLKERVEELKKRQKEADVNTERDDDKELTKQEKKNQ